jgi:uncharacterized membrane protein (DUF106 family)
VLFSSLTNLLQFFGIILAALAVSVATQLIYKKFSDQALIKDLNAKMKEARKKSRGVKDPDELMRLNNEMLKHNSEKMKLIMKPMMVSMLLFVFTFPMWGNLFKGFNLFIFSTSLPVIGADVGWFLTYIIVSLFTSTIVRKKMGVEV